MKTKEKLCLFFASDYHFEMISLPYINGKLKENKEVIMITENDLNSTVSTLLGRINLKPEEKDKIINIDWNNNEDKIKKLQNEDIKNKEKVIFIKGKEEYINSMNQSINNLISDKNTQVIDCYDINEVQENIKDIAKGYSKILSTSGIEKLL
ncbi:MAG: hypothetical protein HFJ59_05655 [Clostridia bacterium]|nr:hypothetical protein [Clostridia bacterium]